MDVSGRRQNTTREKGSALGTKSPGRYALYALMAGLPVMMITIFTVLLMITIGIGGLLVGFALLGALTFYLAYYESDISAYPDELLDVLTIYMILAFGCSLTTFVSVMSREFVGSALVIDETNVSAFVLNLGATYLLMMLAGWNWLFFGQLADKMLPDKAHAQASA